MNYSGEVVGVYRQCLRCQRWRPISYFETYLRKRTQRHGQTCMDCYRGISRIGHAKAFVTRRRGYVLTDSGREAIREAASAA